MFNLEIIQIMEKQTHIVFYFSYQLKCGTILIFSKVGTTLSSIMFYKKKKDCKNNFKDSSNDQIDFYLVKKIRKRTY